MNKPWSLLAPVWQPHPGQEAFLESDAKIKVLACGRRWGKTDACAAQIVLDLLRPSPTRHLVLAPTQDQAGLIFDRVLEMLAGLGEMPKLRRSPYPRLTLGPHRLTARSGHVGRLLRGQEATSIVVDEASYVPESLIAEVAMPMLATTDGTLTLIGTPHGRNHFWRFFQMGVTGENGVWSRQAPSAESPYVSRRFLDVQKALLSERAYAVEYEAEFRDSAGRVFRTDALGDMVGTALPLPVEEPVLVGVDFGRYRDYTAAVVLSGTRDLMQVVETRRFTGLSYAEQVDRVTRLLQAYNAPVVLCDRTGLGDPFVEQLQASARNAAISGFQFNAVSKNQLIDNLAMIVDKRLIKSLPQPELMRELEHYEAKDSGDGNLAQMGGMSGIHDDLVIALALAAWLVPSSPFPVARLGRSRGLGE